MEEERNKAFAQRDSVCVHMLTMFCRCSFANIVTSLRLVVYPSGVSTMKHTVLKMAFRQAYFLFRLL